MRTTKQIIYSISLFFFALHISCSINQNELPEPESEINIISEEITGVQPTIVDNIIETNYPIDYAEGQEEFDWENLTSLPLPTGNLNVPMPWSHEAKRKFSDDIRDDYKKADGWKLYLSSFSKNFRQGNLTFSLYNEYRGILRYYYFIGSGTDKVQDYNILLNHVLCSDNSPLLNFTGQYIVDINYDIRRSVSFEPQSLADSTWYAVEYELAFDKNIYTRNSNFLLGVDFSMKKKNSLSINGHPLNELNAKIRVYNNDKPLENPISANASYLIYGSKDLSQIADNLAASELDHLKNTRDKNILNALKYSPPSMHLKWITKLNLLLAPSGVGILNDSFVVSGSDLSIIQGQGPFYDKALGVFYLNKKPVYEITNGAEKSHPYQYMLDISSVEYLFNPSLLKIAQIENLQQELVATEQEFLIDNNERARIFTGQLLKSNKPIHIQGVRVSFDVVPINGGEKIHFIKTFKGDARKLN